MRDSVWFDGMGTFAADIERIMDTADRLAKQRNHGKARPSSSTNCAMKPCTRKFNVDRSDDTYLGSPLEIKLADLETLRDDATAMAAEMTDLAARLGHFLATPKGPFSTSSLISRRASWWPRRATAGSPL